MQLSNHSNRVVIQEIITDDFPSLNNKYMCKGYVFKLCKHRSNTIFMYGKKIDDKVE